MVRTTKGTNIQPRNGRKPAAKSVKSKAKPKAKASKKKSQEIEGEIVAEIICYIPPPINSDGHVTLEFFRQMKPGQIVHLGYNSTNKGDFLWKHDRVEGDRVFGGFKCADMKYFSDCDDYLYEFMDEVCRGSGAEPMFVIKDESNAS